KFEQIVDFAGINEFLDTPVKRYSSGMYTRLAFAVAAHLEPDILIVDEVLAVGDVGFQKKCIARMADLTRSGRTVIFVSHNMGAVAELCRRAMLLEGGRLVFAGSATDTIARYLVNADTRATREITLSRPADASIYISRIALCDTGGTVMRSAIFGGDATVEIDYVLDRALNSVTIAMELSRNGIPILYSYDTD